MIPVLYVGTFATGYEMEHLNTTYCSHDNIYESNNIYESDYVKNLNSLKLNIKKEYCNLKNDAFVKNYKYQFIKRKLIFNIRNTI